MKIRTVEYAGTIVAPDASFPDSLPQVAFSGRSNVGKSSLINRVLGRHRQKIAHVSSKPGKTQAINFYRVNDNFFLVDLPGFGFAKVPKTMRDSWKTLIEGYLSRGDGARGVVHLVDVRREPASGDLKMLDYLATLGRPTLVVITKIDKVGRSKRRERVQALADQLGLDGEQVVAFSAKTGDGRDDLLKAMEELLGLSESEE